VSMVHGYDIRDGQMGSNLLFFEKSRFDPI
jgi:hypothetical protein